MRVALFAPCFVDQLAPAPAIAAVHVLERLGLDVAIPDGAACCGQAPANAGFAAAGEPALARFVETFAPFDQVVVLSGSCTVHLRAHAAALGATGAAVGARTTEFCAFLHDVIGLERVRALGASCRERVALHIGCHALRGLDLATPSELQRPAMNKVRALLDTVAGLSFATLARADECCGFGGSFSVGEPAVSTRMGRDRLGDITASGATAIVSTDMSCLLHLRGLDRAAGGALPMWHVAELFAGVDRHAHHAATR
jgi:L-lactate dehydrogenase complex protein LldE